MTVVVFGILVGVVVFSVIWYELLMTSAISSPLWSSVCECQRVERAFTSPMRNECRVFVMCCISMSTVLVRGCAVSRSYINDCNSDVLSVVNMYVDHLNFCVVCINGRMYVCCSAFY